MVNRLRGKVAVITGAASGIGEATARLFSEEGANIVIADMQTETGTALAKELGHALFIETDISSEDAVEAAVTYAIEQYGRIDCMVNNAGFVGAVGSICDMSADHWRATMDVLLDGVFFGIKHAARALVKQAEGGSILSTSSVAGLRGGFGAHAYTTAKHAVIGLTRSAASELAASGIRVNAVAPGGVISPLTLELAGNDRAAAAKMSANASPMGVSMYPEEIANAFLYLASDDAKQITGQVITVDAGITMAPEPAPFHSAEPGFMGPPVRTESNGHD